MARVNPQAAPKVSSNTASKKRDVGGVDKPGPDDGISRKNTQVKVTRGK